MARSSLLLDLVRAGARGDHALFRRALEALVTEERAKQHHVLADRLAAHLHAEGTRGNGPVAPPTRRDGTATNLYHEVTTERRLDDLVLPDSVAHAGRELVEEHRRSELLAAYNLQPRHRVLLTGPPGNGKTSFAEAIATELAVPLVSVRYESVIASYLGETAVRLSRLFDQVRTRRCVLLFDEFDVVGKERGDPHETGEIKRVVSSLLLQVDTLPSSVVAISATNHLPSRARQTERLDPKFDALQEALEARRVRVQAESHDLVPEEVIVLETVDTVEHFIRAVEKVPGMEWLAEIEEADIPPDDDFFEVTDSGKRRPDKTLRGRLFVLFTNQVALRILLSMWKEWQENGRLPHGRGVWKRVFERLRDVRLWGVKDRLHETGVLDDWQERVAARRRGGALRDRIVASGHAAATPCRPGSRRHARCGTGRADRHRSCHR